ncbi:MAG: hypothetical protein KF861_12560 [Planctomycetaceae bacterium]|nr:hypothetical protein [Planctomycetaceae bacterium]
MTNFNQSLATPSMPRIILINIGANMSHRSRARCPLFPDGKFEYVPFPLDGNYGSTPYPTNAWPFTNGLSWYQTHADPDWENLTYGDYVLNPRAAILKGARVNDILLFWSLLWENSGASWTTFTNRRSWCLIGSLRIGEILQGGHPIVHTSARNRARAEKNAHFVGRKLEHGHVVFLGTQSYSQLYDYAVPLVANRMTRKSLLYRTLRTTLGTRLPLNGKHWSGYARSCRMICDLGESDGYRRAAILRDAIAAQNDFDLLAGLSDSNGSR